MDSHTLHEQFESRINEHRKIIFKVCNTYCHDRDDREDLAQEMLVQLWRSFGSFDGRCSFSTWMYQVALNTALSFARREFRRRRYVVTAEDRLLASVPAAEPPETDAAEILHQLMAPFDPMNKALLLLYLDGNSYREIADILGLSVTNVATKISRLKAIMKHQFTTKEDTV